MAGSPKASVLAVLAAPVLALAALPAPAAHADVTANVYTTYGPSGGDRAAAMSACKTAVLHLNNYCYGLQNGQAIGVVDAALALDEAAQRLGVPYDDEAPLPTPESATNPLVEVYNGTADYTFVASGSASFYADQGQGIPVYYVPPGADLTGPALDAEAGNVPHDPDVGVGGMVINLAGISGHASPY